MNKASIKTYAIWARNELISRVSQKAYEYGVEKDNIVSSDADSIHGRLLSNDEKNKRRVLISQVTQKGYDQVMEEAAYTWFNRFIALRFMEVNNYLPNKVRLFTNENNEFKPQILEEALHIELLGLDKNKVIALKEANNNEDLYKELLLATCNDMSQYLPGIFKPISDYMTLLFPSNLLREESVLGRLISDIDEDSWSDQVQIIGWLYQYYISEKHEMVVDPLHGKYVKKEEIPAATQLFTTDWVVKYLVDNSVGRYWIERNPDSSLADDLKYLVKFENGSIGAGLKKISPQEVTVFDPCVGSGHFLSYSFDVLMKIYEECGFSSREAAAEIVKNNLFGIDIDERASQLAYFSVMMKGRQYDRKFLNKKISPNVYEIKESNNVDRFIIDYFCGDNDELKRDVSALISALIDAKEYGSILKMPINDFHHINDRFLSLANDNSIYSSYLLGEFREIIKAAELMSKQYAIVATNPPYLNKYDSTLKKFLFDNYKDFWNDLFSVFIYRNSLYCSKDGYTAFMTPFVWMFISSYEKLRHFIIDTKEIVTLIQFEYSAFSDATVPICSFVLRNAAFAHKGLYIRLSDYTGGMDIQKQYFLSAITHLSDCNYVYIANQKDFKLIPGAPIAYWANKDIFNDFNIGVPVGEIADVKRGMTTSDNNRFLRFWPEVNWRKVKINALDKNDALESGAKWFPYSKGGGYRKWYGYQEYLVDWENDGKNVIDFARTINKSYTRTIVNIPYYFKPSVGFSYITSGPFSMRWIPHGFIYDSGGPGMFADESTRIKLIACMNSKPAQVILKLLSPTINLQIADVVRMPFIFDDEKFEKIKKLVLENINISKDDWDSFETSWNFREHPFITVVKSSQNKYSAITVEEAFKTWSLIASQRFNVLKTNEEILNRIFINIYSLEDTLVPTVDNNDVTVSVPDLKRDVQYFISYAVGCMFGRYSLDQPGLIYAGGEWDNSKYHSFEPDKDDIIPICDDEYFDDDILGRFVKFVKVVFGEEHLEDNLSYIASALGEKGPARKVLRDYFINDFYANHLKTYQKRPIYWQFDSGKKNGFKALVYIHRYTPDLIARMRTSYVHEQQSRYENQISMIQNRIDNAGSTSERVKAEKELKKLKDQAEELRVYEEKIHHWADKMEPMDLDDGVKANYAKFQELLTKIK